MAGENVGDVRREPWLGHVENLGEGCDRPRIRDPSQCPERDIPDVGVLDPRRLHRREQRRYRLRIADPAEQLGRERARPPASGVAQPLDVLVDQSEPVIRLEQPRRTCLVVRRACSSSAASSVLRSCNVSGRCSSGSSVRSPQASWKPGSEYLPLRR